MQLFVPPSLLGAATAALTGVEFCRVSALPPSGEFTCGALRQRAGAERSVAVFRGAAIGDLPQLLSEAVPRVLQIEQGELDAAVIFSRDVLPGALRQRVPACLRALVQRWSPEDLLLCAAHVLERLGAGNFPGSLPGVRLAGQSWAGAAGHGLQPAELLSVLPAAVPAASGVSLESLRQAIDRCVVELGLKGAAAQCFAAGLLLYWDFADESHEISQTMEGRGNPRTADYWHGIMHRREPDAGNASYWFRRVGDHPLLRQLGVVLECWAGELGAGAEEPTAVRGLVSGGRLDPFRLIQLSTQAIRSQGSSAERALRLVQHLELVQLLLWDVGGSFVC